MYSQDISTSIFQFLFQFFTPSPEFFKGQTLSAITPKNSFMHTNLTVPSIPALLLNLFLTSFIWPLLILTYFTDTVNKLLDFIQLQHFSKLKHFQIDA